MLNCHMVLHVRCRSLISIGGAAVSSIRLDLGSKGSRMNLQMDFACLCGSYRDGRIEADHLAGGRQYMTHIRCILVLVSLQDPYTVHASVAQARMAVLKLIMLCSRSST